MPTPKTNKNKKSQTRKQKIKLVEAVKRLTPEQREVVCKTSEAVINKRICVFVGTIIRLSTSNNLN